MSDPYAAALGVSVAPKFDSSSSYGTPSDVLDRLMHTESSGNPYAINKQTKAMGPYQFTPETVADLQKRGVKFNPFDPQEARAAADWYLQDLKAKNGGDLNKAVASYGGFVKQDPSGYQSKVLGSQQPANDPYAAALGVSDNQPAQKPAQPAAPTTQQIGGGRGITPASAYWPQNNQQPQQAKQAPQPVRGPHDADPITAIAANQLTGLGSSIVGGWKGLATLASGGSMNDAANAVTQYQQEHTYQPEAGTLNEKAVNLFNSGYNPLTWVGRAGDIAGSKTAEGLNYVGASPEVSGAVGAAVNTAINAAPYVLGWGARNKPLNSIIKIGPAEDAQAAQAAAQRVEPTLQNEASPKPRYKLNTDGTFTRVDQPASGSPQSSVAQHSTAVAQQATQVPTPNRPTIQDASPETQQAIAKLQAKGTPINQDTLNRYIEAESLPVPVKISEGQAMMDPATISDEMNSRGGKNPRVSPEFYNQQGKALAQNLDAIRQNVAPNVAAVDTTQHGQTLIDAYKTVDAARQADIASKYKALEDANGGSFPLDGQAFARSSRAALDKALKAGSVPPDIESSLSQFENGRQMTFQDFETLRSDLADVMRSSSDGRQRAAANIIRQQLESMPLTPEAAALKPLADSARSAAAARFNALDSDPAYKAAVNDGTAAGEASPIADDFVRKYIVGGKRANLMQMRQNLAGDTTAQQTIPAATIDYLKKQSKADVESGRFNAATYNGTLDNLRPKFDVVLDPKTAQQVQQVGNVAKYTSIQPKGSYVNNSNTLVGAASDVGKGLLKGYLNIKTMGATGVAEKVIDSVREGKAAKKSTAPAAGVTKLSDLGRTSP